MASIQQGIMGGFSGKVGTVVGGNWNGVDYMRGRHTNPNDPKSTKQLDQRARFSTVLHFLKPLQEFLRVGFRNRTGRKSTFNAAVSVNMQNALKGVYPDYSIDYTKLKVSMGALPGALNPSVIAGPAGELLFTWENNCDKLGAMANDKVVLLVYHPETQKSVSLLLGNSRMTGSQAFALPDGFGRENLQCYIAFRNISQTNISDSQYVGSVSI
ncbi:MAG: DUF6266 family protein [Methylococcaceae bacterium]|nr:DUF6266 family protein [Prolixibacteraceae bacterium]